MTAIYLSSMLVSPGIHMAPYTTPCTGNPPTRIDTSNSAPFITQASSHPCTTRIQPMRPGQFTQGTTAYQDYSPAQRLQTQRDQQQHIETCP